MTPLLPIGALLVLPIVLPMMTGAVSIILWRRVEAQRALAFLSMSALLAISLELLRTVSHNGIVAVQIGGWQAPYGITLVADLFAAIMVVISAIIGLAVTVYSFEDIDTHRAAKGYYPLLNVLLMGVSGAFLTGDIFNMYVWFEVMLMSSFVLLALGGQPLQMEGALKYVTLNLISSGLFLAAVGILYGLVGTLNMADLAVKLENPSHPGLVTTVAVLFLVAYGIKAAMFPLFFWLPASYHTPPPAVSAIFAGLLTKVGVYSLIRVFTLIFRTDVGLTHGLILVLSAFTMLSGVLGAAAQFEFRRILSFHIVSQIGYMTMGLGLFTPLGLGAAVFYICHHIIVKTNLFLVSGLVRRLYGTGELSRLGGLWRSRPGLALLFLVPAMSLAGLPPLSGFFAKLGLVIAGLETGQYAMVAVALLVSILTMFSMTKLWAEVFWKPFPEGSRAMGHTKHSFRSIRPGALWAYYAPITALALLTLTIGLCAEPFFRLALEAGRQLANPELYIAAVLRSPIP